MAGGTVGQAELVGIAFHVFKAVTAHQLDAVALIVHVVEEGAGLAAAVDHGLAQSVLIGPVGVFAAAHADVVAIVRPQAPEGQEQIIIIGVRAVEDVGPFDAGVVFAQQLFAVALALQGKAGVRVHFEDVDAAGIAAVHHPQLPFLVKEGAGVHHVGKPGGVVSGIATL